MRESMALCGKHPEAEMHSYENPGQPGRVGRWQALGFFALAGALFAGPLNECAFASDGLSPVAAETPISATTTGFMPFTAGVTKGGDAYINIAIDLGRMPPGLSPGLTLSHVGRGELERHTRHEATDALGYGWFIDGTSKISWCAKDARPRPRDLKLDGSDPLCVANRRMVLAHGEHLQPGAEYRTLLERFERVVVRGGPDLTDIWFELFRPDGLVAEYGRTSDARHLAPSASDREGSPDGAIPIAWSVNRLTDEMGSEMRIEYFDDDSGAGYLNRVTYGYGQAGEVRMRYAPRSDVSTVTVGNYSHTHRLRLHRIEAYVQGKKTREYRLESERSESGWERLSRIQLCLFVGDGFASCLAPIVLDWFQPPVALPHIQTVVAGVASPAQTVQYTYGMLSAEGSHDFTFAAEESPFGAFTPTADVLPGPVGTDGFSKAVVTDFVQTGSDGPRTHTRYGYQGRFWRSANNWGAVGFAATRQTDPTTGTRIYTQYRLDFPHYGRPSAFIVYDGPYRPDAEPLRQSFVNYSTKPITHGSARVLLPYPMTNTEFVYENRRLRGVLQETVEEVTVSDSGIDKRALLIEAGSRATPIPSGTWGATRFRLEAVFQSHRREEPPTSSY